MRLIRDILDFVELIALAIYIEAVFLFKIGGRHGQKSPS
jgi:hypothetical protein